MAIQNFVEGGFYGKVGQLIGQRWRNIRIVRAYTKPTDPKTARQQANRRLFAEATQNAQLSLMLNWKSPIFNSADNSAWGLRMASARANQKAGMSGFNLVPVLPVGFIPTYTGNKITLQSAIAGSGATFEIEGNLPNVNREIMVLCGTKATESADYNIAIYSSQFVSGSPATFFLAEPNTSIFNEYTKMLVISNDDNETDKATFYTPETFLSGSAPVVRTFNTTINSVLRSGQTFKVVLGESFITATTTITGVSIRAVKNGAWVNENIASASLVNENGFFAIQFTQSGTYGADTWAFPLGSTVSIGSISAVNAQYDLSASNVTENAFSTDLTRPFFAEVDSCGISGGYFRIKLKQGFTNGSGAFSQSGLVVQNQSYVTETENAGYLDYTEELGKLVLVCENPNDSDVWVAVPGSNIVANILTLAQNGVTCTDTNVSIPYTFIQGIGSFYNQGSNRQNQSISQNMVVYIEVPQTLADIYGALSTAQFLARCSLNATPKRFVYADDAGHETTDLNSITLLGFENGCFKVQLGQGATSAFIGNAIILTSEIIILDSVFNTGFYCVDDEKELPYIWTA